ncbi:acyl-CoA thioesterase [Kribbia dieselivorans]|uniref:acyl-CoA thioesterase n=1 Tax=Kribbia dieselivorans TaxID=331526 RepID=UPI001FE19DAA|nr:thioesterase family protein [Kribbia dieselivorans]
MPPTPYSIQVHLRWSDMDAYGHVNNVQYLRLLEDARIGGFAEWFGLELKAQETGVLVARHEIEYVLPLTFRPAPVEVDMWVERIGGASFTVGYTVRDPDEIGTTTYAIAQTDMVFFDFENNRPQRISQEHLSILKTHLNEPVPFRRRRA